MQELLDIAKEIIPEADITEIDHNPNQIRLSCKAEKNHLRRHKRFQPIIIQLDDDSFPNFGKLPNHVGDKLRVEFTAFIRDKRSQFNPHTTKSSKQGHTPEIWVFSPED